MYFANYKGLAKNPGAEEGTRTPTPLRVRGPEPRASANSATSARYTSSAVSAEPAATPSLANAEPGVKLCRHIEAGRGILPRPLAFYSVLPYTSLASSVISVLLAKSFEIGQPPLASAAALSKTSLVAPGTLAVVVSAIFVIAKPSPTLASVTAAWVSILVGSETRAAQLRAQGH